LDSRGIDRFLPRQISAMSLRFLLTPCLVCFSVVGFPQSAGAQTAPLKSVLDAANGGKGAPAGKSESPEETRARLEQWLREAREGLARIEAATQATALPEGIKPVDVSARRSDLEQMVPTATRLLRNLNSAADARKILESSRAANEAWTGFKEEPPYSLLLVDELQNERDAIQAKLTSYKAALSNLDRLMTSTLAEAKSAEDVLNRQLAALQAAPDNPAAKWRVDAARGKSRLLSMRAAALQTGIESNKELSAAAESDLALVERKIGIASANTRFNDEDFAKLESLSGERKKAIKGELDAVTKRLAAATRERTNAQSALDKLNAAATTGEAPEAIDLAKSRLEVAEDKVETLQYMIEGFESLIQLESLVLEAYKVRREIIEAGKSGAQAEPLASLGEMLERMRAWENVLRNEISGESAELSKLESRVAALAKDDPQFHLLNEQRATTSEKLELLRRMLKNVIAHRKILRRWQIEYSPVEEDVGWFERVGELGKLAADGVEKVWSFEVMSFEDKFELDGESMTVRIPVTLGILLRALLFFIIGYVVISKVASRVQRTLVGRGHIAEAQARTLRNWAMIAASFFLVIGTLSFLKIPLTVFAFFGGALAIGIGFGTQTLIKNFISGIIVLAERKIRVGDVLNVDGIIGTVTEVNTRSSVIRSADDVETMIPNSLFLENRVTNWTLSNSKVRRELRVGVAYGTHPQTVMGILSESAERHGLICKDPAPYVIFEDFGDNALIFCLFFWMEFGRGNNPNIVASDLRLMIEKRFGELGIGVPFPQRDMHLTTDQPIQIQLSRESADQPTP
jgi:small-conductance mechanosensitive channel